MSLKDKRVVVAGGSSGIGFATALAAANQGAEVIIASRNAERVAAALAKLPSSAQGQAVDFTDEAQIKSWFEKIGPFDHLVYTAGEALQLGALAETDVETARQAFEVRYWGAFKTVKHGHALIRKGGSIVLTTGIASLRPNKGWTVPSSTLGAMESLTRALAVELAPLRVNTVSPGIVRTPLWDNMSESDREAMYSHFAAALPTGYIGEAEDIAETYLYLMQERFSTGQIIVVDGGGVLV
ncbi:NAD(P)-dependent dehydrogenase (short-subunit alcohol dehydrogenase family) [Paraburkholderia sp. EB58]|jgi:NAD(P)-dependent dehydrogenase (short-subunit alcohol dehydrogenase family)|uniref:SDR family oxidoreductase n=1 Tax=Paraburkholderia sp. EB58 TaxID=3035125 RepID=UPI003D1FA5AB